MNVIQPEKLALLADRSRVPVAAEAINAEEFAGDLEKYEHLKELTELFFAAKRHHPNVPAPAQP
jgi:hypothetical protein